MNLGESIDQLWCNDIFDHILDRKEVFPNIAVQQWTNCINFYQLSIVLPTVILLFINYEWKDNEFRGVY